jgi:hypothetical protein
MKHVVTSGLGLALAGTLIAFLAWPEPAAPPPSGAQGRPAGAAGPPAGEWGALQAALSTEVAARERLAAEVAELRARLASLTGDPELAGDPGQEGEAGVSAALAAQSGEADAADAREEGGSEERGGGGRRGSRRGGAEPVFDPARVLQLGLSAREAEQLRERHDRAQLDLLAVRDRAEREGWAGTPELREATQAVERELRKDLGEDMYDVMLFGARRSNRVLVRDVFRGSAAEAAGVQPGDLIVGYGGQRVFNGRELRRLIRQSQPGQSTGLQVQRGEQILDLRVAGGPIGAPVRPARRAPLRP